MKYLQFIFLFFISGFCSAQNLNSPCKRESGYSRHTYRKYAHIKTINWKDVYFNNSNNTHYYIKDSTKKVKGYFASGCDLDYKKGGVDAARFIYYDTCRAKIKEVHLFFPGKDNGKTVHIEFYENGKKSKKTITRNYKKTKIITWDKNEKRHVEWKSKSGRQY